MNRTDRLYALVEELRSAAPRTRSAPWLADRFEVSTRTIERDLLALQLAGVPIWATPGPGGGYALDPAMTLPPVNFTSSEATAIAVALSTIGPMPFGNAGRSALRKVVAAMSTSSRSGAEDLAGRIRLFRRREAALPDGGAKTAPLPGVVRAVEQAVAERRVLRMDYEDRSGARTRAREVEPVALVGGRNWYLVGWCRLRKGGRAFRLDRICAAHVTEEHAPPRKLEDVAKELTDWVRGLEL